jgi:hypothetical protein
MRIKMIELDKNSDQNITFSVVFYEWKTDLSLSNVHGIMENIANILGQKPDYVTISKEGKAKSWTHKNFIKKNLDLNSGFDFLDFLWIKEKNVRSDFAVELTCSPNLNRYFTFHFRPCQIENFRDRTANITRLLIDELMPIYGIGYTMKDYFGPTAFAEGSTSRTYFPESGKMYGPTEDVIADAYAFRRVFLSDVRGTVLHRKFRGIYEVNFISDEHLEQRVGHSTLRQFIDEKKIGILKKVLDDFWCWAIPDGDLQKTRKLLLNEDIYFLNTAQI